MYTPAGFTRTATGRSVAALTAVLCWSLFPLQLFVGGVWAAKSDHLDAASVVLAVNVNDEDWLWRLHPLGMPRIAPVLPRLRARHVPFLEDPELGESPPRSTTAPVCSGELEAIDASGTGAGLRVHGHLQEQGSRVRVLDGADRIRGLAKHAPLVEEARATANDFVWAELDRWRGRDRSGGRWLGFSQTGAGNPYRAELLDASGHVVCQAPIRCCLAPSPHVSRPELVIRGSLPEGSLDAADCQAIAGWAWDAVRPDTPLDVHISVSNGKDLTTEASAFRQDLLAHGMGNGRHGFAISADRLGVGPGTWRVSASIAGTGRPLNGSPRDIDCR
jgi:hypothetical protein